MRKKIVIFGLGQRGSIYARYAVRNPEEFIVVAIIENNTERIDYAKKEFPGVPIYEDYHNFLAANCEADIVAVATQDGSHREHAVAMVQAGYDLLLEKPIANNLEDCMEIYRASLTCHRRVIVCHVLRYTPFYSTVKKIIDSGRLGEIVTIDASENVGYFHQAHSYVRGPWRNSKQSSPMILAKCCHDMDIIRYFMGEKCLSVNSCGGLYYFNESHAPQGCAAYCSDCKYADCVYKAQTLYTSNAKSFSAYFDASGGDDETILKKLRHSQYDKCVFKNDNDVVDHQVTIMQFENGKTACHSMTAFSKEIYRDLKIHGTKAELAGSMESNRLEVRTFGGEVEEIKIDISAADVGGHMGGDYFMLKNLYRVLNGEPNEGVSYLGVSLASHIMSFAAERSRQLGGQTVAVQESKEESFDDKNNE